MNYKGFRIEYSETDYLFIISLQSGYTRDIVGHSETIGFAQKMIDFYVNVVDTKDRF
jgi:hypothetical protein